MNDTIYRQAAIDCLCNGKCNEEGRWCDEGACMPVRRINSLPPAQPEQRWIPVTERLPEEDEQVFVYLFDDSPYIAWFCGGRWHTEEFTLDEDEEPAAWMPLPERWRGEGEPK